MSTQVIWKQPWGSGAESTLVQSLQKQNCALHELVSQQWDPKTATIGGVRDYQTSYLAPSGPEWSSVMLHLNSMVGEPLASHLSEASRSAIAFFEYDQAAWGYCLYRSGALVDRFWNIPGVVDVPAEDCVAKVELLTEAFGVSSEQFGPYVRHVVDHDAKAFPDDEFTLGDHWVRVDFMRRLGLRYPNPGRVPGGRHVRIECADK